LERLLSATEDPGIALQSQKPHAETAVAKLNGGDQAVCGGKAMGRFDEYFRLFN